MPLKIRLRCIYYYLFLKKIPKKKGTTLFFALMFFSVLFVHSQAPQQVNYEAIVRDASGNPVTSGTVSVKFLIHDTL